MSPTGAAGDRGVGADTARRSKRKPSARGVAVRLAWVVLVALLALEGLLTLAVHSDVAPGSPFLAGLRDPWVYGSYSTDDAYWEVRFLRKPPESRVDNPERDDRLGWTCDSAQPLAQRLGEPASGAGLPALLLVGDSYARGVHPETWHDFESLAAASPLAAEFAFANAGVGGYGFDQIVLMAEREIARRGSVAAATARRPVLLVSLLLDDDLDRCVLDFRDWPKPRFELAADGALHLALPQVPTVAEYFDRHARIGPPFAPWIARKIADKCMARRPEDSRTDEKQALARALIGRVVEQARNAGWDAMFVLLLYSGALVDPTTLGWRLEVVESELASRGVSWVNVHGAFQEHMQRSGLPIDAYFLPPEHPEHGHYNALGDAVAFQAILQGLSEHFDAGPGGNLCVVQDVRPPAHGGVRPRWSSYDERLLALGLRPPYVHVAGSAESLAIAFDGTTVAGTIRARASLLSSSNGHAAVQVVVNGATVRTLDFAGGAPLDVELSVGDRDALELRLEPSTRPDGGPFELVLSEIRYTPARPWVPPTR